MPPGQAVHGVDRHPAPARLAPVDHPVRPQLHPGPDAIPGLTGYPDLGSGLGRARVGDARCGRDGDGADQARHASDPRVSVAAVGPGFGGRHGGPADARTTVQLPGQAFLRQATGRDLVGPAKLAELVGEVKALRAKAGADAEPYDVVIEAYSSGEFIQLQ